MLLDKNVLIESERSAYGLDALIADDDEPAIAAITVAELEVGVELSTGKRRKARRSACDNEGSQREAIASVTEPALYGDRPVTVFWDARYAAHAFCSPRAAPMMYAFALGVCGRVPPAASVTACYAAQRPGPARGWKPIAGASVRSGRFRHVVGVVAGWSTFR